MRWGVALHVVLELQVQGKAEGGTRHSPALPWPSRRVACEVGPYVGVGCVSGGGQEGMAWTAWRAQPPPRCALHAAARATAQHRFALRGSGSYARRHRVVRQLRNAHAWAGRRSRAGNSWRWEVGGGSWMAHPGDARGAGRARFPVRRRGRGRGRYLPGCTAWGAGSSVREGREGQWFGALTACEVWC